MGKSIRGLKKLLRDDLFNPVNAIQVDDYQNIYDVKNSQIKIEPKYRVLLASSIHGKDIFTIITDDFRLRKGINKNVCFKKVSKNKFSKKKDFQSWKEKIQGDVCVTTPKLNVSKFLKELNKNKLWDWHKLLNMLVDGTGEMDKRLIDVLKTAIIPLPISNHQIWQGLNNHAVAITNSRVGKTSSFIRCTGNTPSRDYSIPGLFGSVSNEGKIIEGKLWGTGSYAFDEFPKQYDRNKESLTGELLTYLNNGEGTRSLVSEIRCIGTKTIFFFGNVPSRWDISSFHRMLTKLGGTEGMDALGTRIGHLLYGDNFKQINGTDEMDIILQNRVRFIIDEMIKEKKKAISAVFRAYKKWIEIPDPEYEEYFEKVRSFASHKSVDMFLKGFKSSWRRVKMGAVKKAIIEYLPLFYSTSTRNIIKNIKNSILTNYAILKSHNYNSFEFLFHGKKAKVIEILKNGGSYQEVILHGIDITLPTFNKWQWEFRQNREKN